MNIAHYRGDHTDLPYSRVYGPDTCGAFYRAISAEYDADTDVTTVQFKPIWGANAG